MTMQVRMWIAGVSCAAALALVSASAAAVVLGDTPEQAAVKKVAEAVKKGNKDGIKKAAAEAAKKFDEPADLMHMYRPRNKGAMGWGPKAGTNPATDGLEKKI